MGRRLRYQVAVSLDGFIAGPSGEYDWIVMDPSIDFAALFKEFDTAVMGRKTYEVLTAQGGHGAMPGLEVVVFSRTLSAAAHPGVRILNDDPREIVEALKAKPGRDIWLYGGGVLFRSLLDAGLVDTVEVAVVPVLLGAGVPLLPPGAATKLVLADQETLPLSGIVALAYAVPGGVGPAPSIRYIKAAKLRAQVTPGLLFVVGASGAGKTAAVRALEARRMSGVRCYFFDSLGVPTPDVMEREWGSGENWQEQMTKRWIERLAANTDAVELAVLEGQTRPSFIQPQLARAGISHARILLLDCTPAVRMARLRGPRGQPQLAGDGMHAWAVYLRGQADALGLRVLDTSNLSIEGVADVLQEEIDALRSATGAAA